jgi:hypothetical protein
LIAQIDEKFISSGEVLVSAQLISPNIVMEWLTFMFHIREVQGSNLGLETDYPD